MFTTQDGSEAGSVIFIKIKEKNKEGIVARKGTKGQERRKMRIYHEREKASRRERPS